MLTLTIFSLQQFNRRQRSDLSSQGEEGRLHSRLNDLSALLTQSLNRRVSEVPGKATLDASLDHPIFFRKFARSRTFRDFFVFCRSGIYPGSSRLRTLRGRSLRQRADGLSPFRHAAHSDASVIAPLVRHILNDESRISIFFSCSSFWSQARTLSGTGAALTSAEERAGCSNAWHRHG